jgi:phosphoribosylformimino-5-aminoimidazole carboxamide ribotide isomerase
VIGSQAVKNTKAVLAWLDEWSPERFVLALDVMFNDEQQPIIMTQGWENNSAQNVWTLLKQFQGSGLKTVLCTDIACDGTLKSPNFALYEEAMQRFPEINWQASGGVASLFDLKKLQALQLSGVIIGKALLENRFSLREALAQCQI